MITMAIRLKRIRFILLIMLLILGIPAVTAVMLHFQKSSPTARLNTTQIVALAKTNEQRMNFLSQYGWEVEQEPIEVVDVVIPLQFNDVYNNYNTIQKKQNMNLEKYKGKTVKRYTYKVTNYPQAGQNEIRADLLVYNERVIGGDIGSVRLDGFMHGFKLE